MIKHTITFFQPIAMKLERYSLQQRLFLSYIVIILIPSIIISLIIFKQLNANLMKDVIRKSENAVDTEITYAKNNMETMERTVQLSLSDKEILYYLERSSEPDTAELIDFSNSTVKNIARLQFNNPNIEHIRIYADNPHINEMWPVFLMESRIRKEPWHDKVIALDVAELWQFDSMDREPIHQATADSNESRPKISLLREIEYPKGKHVGIIQIDMLLHNFFSGIFQARDNSQSQMLIMDHNGRIFRAPDAGFFAESGLTDLMLSQQLLQHRSGRTESFNFSVNGKPFLGTLGYIDGIQAYILNVTSLQTVLADINKTRNYILLVNVILIAILSISTYFFTSLILKKLRMLTLSMKSIRLGNFNIQLPVGGGSEVGELTHHFRQMMGKINELIADAVTKQAATKEAELKTLKNQIDSHFLYNTLENIKMLAEIENQQPIADALTSLGTMMRYNLKWKSEYVTLREELNHIIHYVAIMNLRFDGRIRLQMDFSEYELDQEVLKLSLQPIVENAVKHGLPPASSAASRDFMVSIKANLQRPQFVIVIEDNGIGISASSIEQLNRKLQSAGDQLEEQISAKKGASPLAETAKPRGTGIGLINVHQRIQLFYGKEYGLTIESEEGRYTRIVMKLPYYNETGGIS